LNLIAFKNLNKCIFIFKEIDFIFNSIFFLKNKYEFKSFTVATALSHERYVDYLPDEAIIEILTRLPVKSLIKFRCVSKTWRSLISSPFLIANHLNLALSDPQYPPYLLFHYSDDLHQKQRFTLHSPDDPFPQNQSREEGEEEDEKGFFDYPSGFIELHSPLESTKLSLVNSCAGLVCLACGFLELKNSFIFWNPSIRKAISVPEPNIGLKSDPLLHYLGFGYDSKNDDYKLVRLVYSLRYGWYLPPLVEIYTLRTGEWRSVTAPAPPCFISLSYLSNLSLPVFLNGKVHWFAVTPQHQGAIRRNVIVTFGMEDEAFGEMGMPKSLEGVDNLDFFVTLVDGLLAVLPRGGATEFHSLWVMKKYGVPESWTKLFHIETGEGFERVIGFTKNGEVLLTKDEKMFSYEPSSQRTLDLHISGEIVFFALDTYVESLVLLNVADGDPGRQGNSSAGS
jgi:F-box interacting protein